MLERYDALKSREADLYELGGDELNNFGYFLKLDPDLRHAADALAKLR